MRSVFINDMKKYAIIVAGGSGTRMGTSIPKQFLLLNGKPVLHYSIDVFLEAFSDLEVILVLPETQLSSLELTAAQKGRVKITTGGPTRFHSVQNGLKLVNKESIIFVHDAVRCLVSASLIYRCYETALEKGSGIPAIASKDSIRLLNENGSIAFDRNHVMLVQTPQTFRSELLLAAFNKNYEDSFTDEATVAEAAGIPIHLVQGEENNIKITTPVDWLIAEKLLATP
jgi:2-C-methyl-D-erythritol 4-phosphate cytidylyltransferase